MLLLLLFRSTYLDISFPYCECDFHRIISRTLIGQMNDTYLTNSYLNALKKHVQPNSVCLFVGNLSFVGLAAALFGASKVSIYFIFISFTNTTYFIKTTITIQVYYYDVSGPQSFVKVLNTYIKANVLEDKVILLKTYKEVLEIISKQTEVSIFY